MKKIKEIFDLVRTHFFYKVVFSLCVGVIYCLFAYQQSMGSATAYLALNYPLALHGQYLNGTRLNMYDILSEETLQNAIDKAGLTGKLSPGSLSNMITVSPRHSSTPTNEYIATEFVVNIYMDKPIYNVEAKSLLQMVCMAFIETFYDTHSYNQTVLTFTLDGIDNMDYDEIGIMLRTKIDLIMDYIDYRDADAKDYVSSDTGESFTSLRQKITDFSTVILENYDAYVLNNGVTRNIDALRSSLEYQQMLLTKKYDVSIASYDERIAAVSDYDPVQSAIVMIPTVDDTGEFYMSKTKIGVDYLAEEANIAMGEAVAIKKDIDKNNLRLQLAESVTQLQRNASAKKLNSMINGILDSLSDLEQLVIKTDDEYIRQQTAESLTYRMSYSAAMTQYGVKDAVMYMAAVFAALTAILWLREKYESEQNRKNGEQNA